MGSFSKYSEKKILDHVFGGGNFTRPGSLYFGLSTTSISDDGTNISEPDAPSYERVEVINNDINFPEAEDVAGKTTKSNGQAIIFPEAEESWGTVIDWFAVDSLNNVVIYGTLTVPKTITIGDILKFQAGSLVITLD